jgi:hypothetical protein
LQAKKCGRYARKCMGDSNVAACQKAVIAILVISFSRFLDVDQIEKYFSGTCECWTALLN